LFSQLEGSQEEAEIVDEQTVDQYGEQGEENEGETPEEET